MVRLKDDKKTSAGKRPNVPAAGAPGASPLVATGGVFTETKRLTIRLLKDAYEHHIAALNNREYMRFSEQRHIIHDRVSQEVYIRSHYNSVGALLPDKRLLDLVHRGTNQSVGSVSCYLDWLNLTCDMGLMIVPEQAGQGFGCEAWVAVMDQWLKHGFKVEAGMMTKNRRMRRICVASGMHYEGDRPHHFRVDGKPMGLSMYGKAP